MNRPNCKRLWIGGIVVLALLCAAPQADARCWGCGSWGSYYGGWYGGWGSYWTGCGGGCGGYGYYAPYYSGCCSTCYGGCSSCGYSACGYSSCGSCGDSYGGSCSSCQPASSTIPSTPSNAPTPVSPTPAPPSLPGPGPAPKSTGTSTDDSGSLTVWVPYDAKVIINGLETRSTGSRRQFYSSGLKPGLNYTYVVRAQVIRNGQVQEDTQKVTLTAGQINAVAFGFNAVQQVATTP